MPSGLTQSTILPLLLIATIPFSLATAVWWLVATVRMLATRRSLGTCEDGLRHECVRSVLVVIPAHNEADAIGPLIDSLKLQDYPKCRFVLALDRCTDTTETVARHHIGADPRFVIHAIASCPEGWAGKVHAIDSACRAFAASDPSVELLLFADADTLLHPSCIRAAAGVLSSRRLDMLSLLSTLSMDRPFERAAQGPCVFELMRRYPPDLASRDHDRRPFANGQFMLWVRDAYDRVGTHAAFKNELLEDISMARAAWNERLRVHVLPAASMLHCRMYPNESAFRRGWRRIFTESANRKPDRLRSWARAAAIRGVVAPGVTALVMLAATTSLMVSPDSPMVATASLSAAALAMALCWVGVWLFLSLAAVPAAVRWRSLLTWPFGCLMLRSILLDAARDLRSRTPTVWGGIEYERSPR